MKHTLYFIDSLQSCNPCALTSDIKMCPKRNKLNKTQYPQVRLGNRNLGIGLLSSGALMGPSSFEGAR